MVSPYTNIDYSQEDAGIAWHFTEVKSRVEQGYNVQGKIHPDCLKHIKGLPIANFIGDKLYPDEKNSNNLIVSILVIFLIIIITVFLKTSSDNKKRDN